MPQHCSLFGMEDQHGRDIRQEAKPQGARHTCHWAKVMTMLLLFLMMLMMPIIIINDDDDDVDVDVDDDDEDLTLPH